MNNNLNNQNNNNNFSTSQNNNEFDANNFNQGNQSQNVNNTFNYQNNVSSTNTNKQACNEEYKLEKKVTKKKLKWQIPLILFLLYFLPTIIKIILHLIGFDVYSKGSLSYKLIQLFNVLGIISMFLVFPSIIFVIVEYNKKTPKEKVFYQNNDISSDEVLLKTYVGSNYGKIKNQKFSVVAFFLNWMYMGYRKFYKLLLIYVIPMSILSVIFNENLLILIYIPFSILAGLKFNKWYLDDAKKQINKIKMSNPQASESELISICSKKGGTSIVPVILTFVGITVLGSIIRVAVTIILRAFLGAI